MKGWTLRQQILFLALVPAAMVAVALVLYYSHTRIADLDESLRERGTAIARQLAPASEYGVFSGNRNILFTLANAALEEDQVRSVSIYDNNRRLLSHGGPSMRPHDAAAFAGDAISMQTSEDGESLLFQAPIRPSQVVIEDLEQFMDIDPTRDQKLSTLGYAVVELSLEEIQRQKSLVVLTGVVISGALLILSGILGWLMSAGVSRPVAQLAHMANEFERGNLDARMAPVDAPRELERLGECLNMMGKALNASRNEMQQQVEDATRELRETLDALEIQNAELSIAKKEAQSASRVKSDFLANMSHEIRTPLNGVVGYINLLQKTQLDPTQADYARTIQESATTLLRIVNDILDFSKIEAGKMELEVLDLVLRDCLEEVMDVVAPAATEKGLELAYHIHMNVPAIIRSDPTRLRQILLNLVSNAVKFTASGSINVRVMRDEDARGLGLRFMVHDTGIGLSEEQQARLFQTFTQADPSLSRRYGGTGLGLVISRRLVERLGGEMTLSSVPGEGTTMTFTIRCEAAVDHGGEPPTGPFKGSRVLLYEQHPAVRMMLHEMLETLGLEIQEVPIIDHRPAPVPDLDYDVIVASLPSGVADETTVDAVCESLPGCHSARVIVSCAPLSKELRDHLAARGVSALLGKPVRLRKLEDALDRLLNSPRDDDLVWDPPQNELGRKRFPGARVLVAEDNEISRRLAATLLRALGADVETVADGHAAVDLAVARDFDLILMDVHMPVMDGPTATARFRALRHGGRYTPVVAVTADVVMDSRERFLAAGMDDVLNKPISEQALTALLDRWLPMQLERSRADQDTTAAEVLSDAAALRIAGGRHGLVDELRGMLHKELDNHVDGLREALHEGDLAQVAELAHRMAGGAMQCGARALERSSRQLQKMAEAGDRPGLEEAIGHHAEDVARLSRTLENHYWPDREAS
ncbi:MAG: ATP-binding protein [Gammaproteobacteria bacterium]|nr:ATP-binding protein [Gammaproteobacteria bacterium]